MSEDDIKHLEKFASMSWISEKDFIAELREIDGGIEYIKEITKTDQLKTAINEYLRKFRGEKTLSPYSQNA